MLTVLQICYLTSKMPQRQPVLHPAEPCFQALQHVLVLESLKTRFSRVEVGAGRGLTVWAVQAAAATAQLVLEAAGLLSCMPAFTI